MSKPRRNKKEIWEMILLMCVILIIPLFFAIKSLARPQDSRSTVEPTKAVVVNQVGTTPTVNGIQAPASVATATPVAHGKQPPACTFPLAQLPPVESKSENYSFSTLKVVRTGEKGNQYEIAEWLPDSQQVLMTEELRNVKVADGTPHQERIELFDPIKGTSKLYAVRPLSRGYPVWFRGMNAVVFPVTDIYDHTPTTGTYTAVHRVFISHGNPAVADLLADNLPQIPFALKPDGGTLLFLTKNRISKLNTSLKGSSLVDFDPVQWDYATSRRDLNPVSFEMVWQPGTSLIFLYTDGAMGGGGYTYLLNADSGTICQLDLGGWAVKAHWSTDGRYLAIIQATNYSFPISSARLTVMDAVTGIVSVLPGVPQGTDGHLDVNDLGVFHLS